VRGTLWLAGCRKRREEQEKRDGQERGALCLAGCSKRAEEQEGGEQVRGTLIEASVHLGVLFHGPFLAVEGGDGAHVTQRLLGQRVCSCKHCTSMIKDFVRLHTD